MARKCRTKWIIGLALLFVLFTGCFGGGSTDPAVGDLELTITLPDTMNAHKVTVSLTHDSTSTVVERDLEISNFTATYTFKELKTGNWSVLVSAKDNKDVQIGSAIDSVTIVKGKSVKLEVQVEQTMESWFGKPSAHPFLMSTNQEKTVWIRTLVNLPADQLAVVENGQSAVELFALVDGEWQSRGYLFDNGDLANGDEIRGDRVFSGYFEFNEPNPGIFSLKVVVFLADGTEENRELELEFVDTSLLDEAEISDTHNTAQEKLKNMAPESSIDTMLTELATVLKSDSELIQETSVQGNILEIEYVSGLKSLILLTDEDSLLKGGGSAPATVGEARPEREGGRIPLNKQTRGDTSDFSGMGLTHYSPFTLTENQIGSRSILFWAPFATEFAPYEESITVSPIFNEADLGFDVTVMQDFACSVASLLDFPDYGMIVISTHGSGGRWLVTGELVVQDSGKYLEEQLMNQIAVCQEMKRVQDGSIITKEPVYAVNDAWLNANLMGEFPNSIIVNSSCESTKTNNLWHVFEAFGAGAYFGFSESVFSDFAVAKVKQLSEGLAEGKTTGESYEPGTDPNSGAAWQIYGDHNLAFAGGLLNGSFEDGLAAWTTDGDGRVITTLGFLNPTHQGKMGIISTGLGFTVAHGTITQTFVVPQNANELKFDWNFLSEEFLEFIGSIYMDWFKVSLVVEGDTIVLYEKTIDDIAEDFGAVYCESGSFHEDYDEDYDEGHEDHGGGAEHCIEIGAGGDLVHVSPEIVFDQGDVWMTDWQSLSYDFSEFRGKKVTLIFGCHDVGDSIYDTAVLLDNIRIE